MCGNYTRIGTLLEGHLHVRTIQTKITPNLASLAPIVKKEVDSALAKIIPQCEGGCQTPISRVWFLD